MTDVAIDRRAKALGWFTLALWGVQAWRPQLSFPGNGVAEVGLLLLFLVASGILVLQQSSTEGGFSNPPATGTENRKVSDVVLSEFDVVGGRVGKPALRLQNPAACLGFVFLAYCSGRWIIAGTPAAGAENFGTLIETGIWAAVVYNLIRIQSDPSRFVSAFILVFSVLAAVCGIHAIAQYVFLYDRQLAELKTAIGAAEPTQLEIGLLHHLQLKRVASIWGDPNALGAFLALSLAASYRCAASFRRSPLTGVIGALAIPLAMVGIGLSGSRGAVVDAFLISLICLWPTRRNRKAAALVAASALFLAGAASGMTGQTMLTRSNTLRERMNYAQVGFQIIERSPVFGSAPGAVDLFYGRYKPPEARESKYLHNWPLQIAAEYGVVGLGLAVLFLGVALWRAARSPWMRHPEFLAILAIFGVFLVDAFFELSFNHRELMALFGMACGVVLFMGGARRPGRIPWIGIAANALLGALGIAYVIPYLIASGHKDAAEDAIKNKEMVEARRQLRLAEQWTPRDPSIYVMLAQTEDLAGSPDSAAMFVKKAISIQPESASLHAQLSRIEMAAGNLDEAERLARRAIELYPTNADYHYDLARVYEQRGQYPRALDEARLAVKHGYYFLDKYKAYAAQLEKRVSSP